MRAICAVRYATGILAALTSSIPSGIRQRLSFRTASHSLSAPSSKTPYGPVNITREPTGKSVPPPSSTTPAPSLPRTSGAFSWWGNLPERIVWSSGVTPAAVMRTSTLPSALRGRGASTSFRPSYPVNDSARIVLIIAELMVFSFSCFGRNGRPLTLPRFKPSGLKKSVKWTAHRELLHLLRLVGAPLVFEQGRDFRGRGNSLTLVRSRHPQTTPFPRRNCWRRKRETPRPWRSHRAYRPC